MKFFRPSRIPHPARAFSLIEILIAVTMLGFIMLGLMSMFAYTQRAFRAGMSQTDVLEAGRATISMISGDFEAATPSRIGSATNFHVLYHNNFFSYNFLPGVNDTNAPGALASRTNVFQQAFFLVQENKRWYGIGYVVAVPNELVASNQVGTLYRFQYPPPGAGTNNPSSLCTNFLRVAGNAVSNIPMMLLEAGNNSNISTNLHRIADGVVHFRVRAYNVTNALIVPPGIGNAIKAANNTLIPPAEISYAFTDDAVPASLDLELGVLEAQALERFKGLINTIAPLATRYRPARDYFQRQAAHVQLFRRHITVRNVDPEAYQ